MAGLPDGQFIGHFHSNWPISEGVGQKKKFVARNIFLANLKKYTLTKFSSGYLTNLWPILGQISYYVKFMSLKKTKIMIF